MTLTAFARFAEAVRSGPDRPILEDRYGSVTRLELMQEVSGLARQLRTVDLTNQIVGVFLNRDRHLPAAILAASAAGAAYLPLDPVQPDARLHAMIRDGRPSVIITSSELVSRLPHGCPALIAEQVAAKQEISFEQDVDEPSDHIAYLMYTSGSSGVPKGVAVGRGALTNFFTTLDSILSTPDSQVWQSISSIGFDLSLADLVWPVSRGKYVCLGPNDPLGLMDSPLVCGTRNGDSVNHILATPSMIRLLATHGPSLYGLRRLDTLLVGGEPFPSELLADLTAGVASPRLVNIYGPTEATVWVAYTAVTNETPVPCPIGGPVAGTSLYVLDENLNPADAGRLFVSGPPLSFGYWRRPGMTADRFLPDPFAGPGARMYDTGDLAEVSRDGHITVTGRSDSQVKVRGNRVELGEIEAVLRSCPWVHDAMCLFEPANGQTGALIAVVLVTHDRTEGEIRSWLTGRLPSYMVPDRLFCRDRLPLSAASKLDRTALRHWLTDQLTKGPGYS